MTIDKEQRYCSCTMYDKQQSETLTKIINDNKYQRIDKRNSVHTFLSYSHPTNRLTDNSLAICRMSLTRHSIFNQLFLRDHIYTSVSQLWGGSQVPGGDDGWLNSHGLPPYTKTTANAADHWQSSFYVKMY